MTRVLIFANGELPDLAAAAALLRTGDVILAADGGTRHALQLGLMPSLVVGDMDSLPLDQRRQVEAAGVRLIPYPHDKNETDLELAIRHALELRPESILLIGVLGRRLDHMLGNLSLLSDPAYAAYDIRADDGVEEVFFCRRQVAIRGKAGEILSLIPWGVDVSGVQTAGLKWPLADETLYAVKTRGISNELTGETASVEIATGLLLVVHRRM